MRMLLLLLIGFLGLLLSKPLLGQQPTEVKSPPKELREPKSFNRATWKKATRGLDYTVNKRREKSKTEKQPIQKSGNENSQTYFILLVVILMAAIIALLIAAFTGHLGPRGKPLQAMSVSIEDIKENVFESDLERLIQQAIEAENYPRAIRLYFLEILKQLALQKKINWKKEKTNRHYYYELQASSLATEFDQLASVFDRIRYGQTPIAQTDFEQLAPEFNAFLQKLKAEKAKHT